MYRTRSLALAALTVVATVVVSSCGVLADDSAGSVLGRTVTVESVEQLSRDEGFVGSEESGVEDGAVPGDLFRSVLAFELQRTAWIAEAERWGLEITPEITEAASQQVEAQLSSTGATYERATREKLEEYVAAQTALETRFSQLDPSNDADLRLLYEGVPAFWEQTCVAAVQITADQEDAVDQALADGAPIEELPTVVEGSTLAADPSQCLPGSPGQLPEELETAFREATPGSNEGPVAVGDPAAGGASFVFRVDDRRTIGFDEARDQLARIAQGLAQQGAQAWIALILAEAQIDSRFGSSVTVSNGQPMIDAPPAPLQPQLDLGGMLGTTPEAAVPEDDGHAH